MFCLAGENAFINKLSPIVLLLLLGLVIFGGLSSVVMEPGRVIAWHGIFELANIIIGFIIFCITWYGTGNGNGLRVTVISLVVISSTLLQVVHLLSYPGVTGDPLGADHIWLTSWMFSRLIWSFGLLYAAGLPAANSCHKIISNKGLLYCTLICVAALIANIIFSYDLPYLSINDYCNPLAKFIQYGNLVASLTALIIFYRRSNDHVSKLLVAALFFGTFSDLSFSLSIHTSFSINIAGHFFKVLANFYILRSIYLQVIRLPYEEVIKLKEEMEELADNNARLYRQSEHQRNLVEDVLAKIGMIISSQLDVKSTLEAIADMVADMMHTRQSAIALFSKDRCSLQVVATYGFSAPPESIPLKNSLAGKVCEAKTVLSIDDLALQPEIFRPQLIFANIRSIICAPLLNDQEIIGVVEAYSTEKGMFSKRDALLLKGLGYHAGAAIASALLYEKTKLRLDEEQFLYQIAQASAASIDIDTILEQCVAHSARALNADLAMGFLIYESLPRTLVYKTSVGINHKPAAFELENYPQLAEFLAGGIPVLKPADSFPPLDELSANSLNGPIMIMPLPVDHRLLGAIILGWQRHISQERSERASFAALLAQQIALGLEKAHLYNQVRAMALSDGLTGLANRRNFDMFLNTELRRAATLKRPLSLIMLDLDKFKNYNDTYGHTVGDKLLTQLGRILQQTVRNIDLPARYGGEEFSIILPECSNREALSLAEKIRAAVEAGSYPDNAGTFTAKITASLGVTTYDPALGSLMPDIAGFVASADEALYKAKEQGRNKVVNSNIL